MKSNVGILQKKRVTIIFIPFYEGKTSERIPSIVKVLSKRYSLVGLRPHSQLRVTRRGKKAFWLYEWVLEKFTLTLKGVKMGIQNSADLIFCEEPEYAIVGLAISKILRKPVIYDSHGNKYLQCKRFGKPFYYTIYITFSDLISAKMSTLLLAVSEFDKNIYHHQGVSCEKIQVIPSFINLKKVDNAKTGSSKYESLFKGKKILLFIGNFTYQPNVEALRFINNELAPALEHIDNVEICICGHSSVPIQHLTGCILHRKVTYLGFVPNVYEVLHAADAIMCPLWRAVGIIVKMLDAMAVGKPIVATSLLKEGIPELNKYNVFLAKNKNEFIRMVIDLLEHYDKYEHMGRDFRRIIITKYTEEVIEKQLFSVIHNVVSSNIHVEKTSSAKYPEPANMQCAVNYGLAVKRNFGNLVNND